MNTICATSMSTRALPRVPRTYSCAADPAATGAVRDGDIWQRPGAPGEPATTYTRVRGAWVAAGSSGIARQLIALGAALALTGCAQASWHPLPQQPHALVAAPAAQPFCVFMCRLIITVGEGVASQAITESESINTPPLMAPIPGVTP